MHQIAGLSLVGLSIAARSLFGSHWLIDLVGVSTFAIGVFWYVVMGHALIYGPHLFLVWIWMALADLVGRRDRN